MKIAENITCDIECHRGEIRYMMKTEVIGSEQSGGRPVIIISNEQCNKVSSVVTVVPITTQEKAFLPTHFKLDDNKYSVYGTVLCEQIQSCSKLRLGQYVGDVDDRDLRQIEKCIKIQLALKASQNAQPNTITIVKPDDKLLGQLEEANMKIKRLELELIKTQQREIVFRELYEERVRKS